MRVGGQIMKADNITYSELFVFINKTKARNEGILRSKEITAQDLIDNN